jgi:hypothetical protein
VSDRFEDLAVRTLNDLAVRWHPSLYEEKIRLVADALRSAHARGLEESATRDAATLARVRRLSAACGEHFRDEMLDMYLAIALDKDLTDRCPRCNRDDCEVWGTV